MKNISPKEQIEQTKINIELSINEKSLNREQLESHLQTILDGVPLEKIAKIAKHVRDKTSSYYLIINSL